MYIYKITNLINGKIYVGQTSRTPEIRFSEHVHADSYIGSAIRKYGRANFKIEVLEECESKKELDNREQYWIARFESMGPNGYNLTEGGNDRNYGTQNGDGFMLMYRDAIGLLAKTAPPLALRVFLTLSAKQEFEGGLKSTKKAVADELEITYENIMKAFKWLKEHAYVKERKVNGQTEFLLNPNVTTCGKNRKDIKIGSALRLRPLW